MTTGDSDLLLAARAAVAKLTIQEKAQLLIELAQEIAAAVAAPAPADADRQAKNARATAEERDDQ